MAAALGRALMGGQALRLADEPPFPMWAPERMVGRIVVIDRGALTARG